MRVAWPGSRELVLPPIGETALNLKLMRTIDELYLKRPYFGSRRIADEIDVNRKRVQRLMRVMGLEAIYPKPRTTVRCPEHKIYPYLLRNVEIERPNHVWSTDITYIPMRGGFVYLTAVMDWYSRHVLSWRLPPAAPVAGVAWAACRSLFNLLGRNIGLYDQGAVVDDNSNGRAHFQTEIALTLFVPCFGVGERLIKQRACATRPESRQLGLARPADAGDKGIGPCTRKVV